MMCKFKGSCLNFKDVDGVCASTRECMRYLKLKTDSIKVMDTDGAKCLTCTVLTPEEKIMILTCLKRKLTMAISDEECRTIINLITKF